MGSADFAGGWNYLARRPSEQDLDPCLPLVLSTTGLWRVVIKHSSPPHHHQEQGLLQQNTCAVERTWVLPLAIFP